MNPGRLKGELDQGGGSGDLDTGTVVGVVLGMLGGAAIVVAGSWLVWRRRRVGRKMVDGILASGRGEGVELRNLQGVAVVRRPDSRDGEGEAPPSYHEVVKER